MSLSIPATDIATLLPIYYRAKRVPMFVGRPGMAKTAMVREAARQMSQSYGEEVVVRELHLASMSEVDVRGYLIPNGDRAVFTQPEFWATVEKSPRGILFLDEFPQASPEVQKAVAPLLLEGRIGEYELPEGWAVVLAGNSIEDGAGANSLLTHVLNRIAYIRVDPPAVEEWVSWGVTAGMPPELLALAQLRPDVVFESEIPGAPDTPYCTPRSMHALGDVSNEYPGGLVEMCANPVGMAMMAAQIGEGPAAEVAGLVRTTMRLPSFASVMADPENAPVPTDPAEAYAMVMLVAVRADGEEHRESAAQYMVRFPVNFALTGIVSLVRKDTAFLYSKTFGKWVADNRSVVAKFQKYISL